VRRAGATGEFLIRADSAFHSNKVIDYLEAKGCLFSIAVKQRKPIAERIASIPASAWHPVPDYSETGSASSPRPPPGTAGGWTFAMSTCTSRRDRGSCSLLAPLRLPHQ
jgi:hypothetical protein